MLDDRVPEALTFDDVLLVPQKSEVLPSEADISSRLTRTIQRNLPIEAQAAEVDKVKRSESGMIVDPVTVPPTARVADALELMARFRISGVPVTVGTRLVGI